MKCVVCKEVDASTKKIVQVNTDTHDIREPLVVQQIDVCEACFSKIESGEFAINIIPNKTD